MVTIKPINQPKQKITDVRDPNIFGIHLHTQKALEAFQAKSGMKGPYTAEYQHHYWAAVGRMEIENQTLDVCIPLVMFNYPQKVTSGSVKFDLREVSSVGDQLIELADAKCKEFLSICGAEMTQTFGFTWSFVPQMTMHVHPGRMDVFSGTDYDKKIDDPGVVYPLNAGEKLPSFSSIMGHKGSEPVLLRTEYRMFDGTPDGDKNYRRGKCLSYVRRDKKKNGPIEAMFIGNDSLEKSYIFKDGFRAEEGDELLGMLAKIFDASGFEPSTDFILEKNVVRTHYAGIRQTANDWGKPSVNDSGKPLGHHGRQTEMFRENVKEKGLDRGATEDVGDYTEKELREMGRFLISEGDFRIQQVAAMDDEDILFFYVATVDEMETLKRKDIPVQIVGELIAEQIDQEEEDAGLTKHVNDEKDGEGGTSWMHHTEEEFEFLKANGFLEEDIFKMEDEEITFILNELGFTSDLTLIQEQ